MHEERTAKLRESGGVGDRQNRPNGESRAGTASRRGRSNRRSARRERSSRPRRADRRIGAAGAKGDVYTNNRRQLRGWTALCWFFCTTIALLGGATPLLIPTVHRFTWGWYARGPLYNFVWAAGFGVILIAAMRLFWRTHRNAEGEER